MSLVSGWCNGHAPKHKQCRDAGCTCTCHGSIEPTHVVGTVEPNTDGTWIWECSCGTTGSHAQALYAKIQRTAHLKRNSS